MLNTTHTDTKLLTAFSMLKYCTRAAIELSCPQPGLGVMQTRCCRALVAFVSLSGACVHGLPVPLQEHHQCGS